MNIHKIMIFTMLIGLFFGCKENNANKSESNKVDTLEYVEKIPAQKVDSIQISTQHKVNEIKLDLDGDQLEDIVQIVRNIKNNKSGLKIIFGNQRKIDYLGMGKDIIDQGFDDLDWVGIFEVASKNEWYYNNVNDEGEIITEDVVKEEDKIRLENDGIFIHAAESCGGGIIYLKDGKYAWIQQE